MGLTWLGVIPLLNGLVVQMFGIKFLSTLTGIAFFSATRSARSWAPGAAAPSTMRWAPTTARCRSA